MAEITTKYSVGDAVFHASTTTERKRHPCPDCLGSRKWLAKSPAGREYEFGCPRCADGYRSDHDSSIDYTAFIPSIQRLTIGQVRAQVGHEPRNEYMCRETGIGSGSVYYEKDLFPTEAEALDAATIKAAASNIQVPWAAEQYSKSLEISDYQLSDASVKAERDRLSKIRITLNYLVEDIRGCSTIEEVQREIDKFDKIAEAA